MAEMTVAQLANLIKINENALLKKFEQSGVHKNSPSDKVTDAEKNQLLRFVQNVSHKSESSITLQRKITRQLKVFGNRKVNIEVRRKKIIIAPRCDFINDNSSDNKKTQADIKGEIRKIQELNSNKKDILSTLTSSPLSSEYNKVVEKKTHDESLNTVKVNILEREKTQNTQLLSKNKTFFEGSIEEEKKPQSEEARRKDSGFRLQERTLKKVKNSESSGFKITARPENITEAKEEKEPLTKHNLQKSKTNSKKTITRIKYKIEEEEDSSRKIQRKLKLKAESKPSSFNIYEYESDDYATSSSDYLRNKLPKPKKTHPNNKVKTQQFKKPIEKVTKQIIIFEGITVNELAQKMAVKAAKLIKILFKMGIISTINESLDQETAILIVEELGHEYTLHRDEALEKTLTSSNTSDQEMMPRPPVVTIMGHVDHGKTSLLDYIRKTRVARSEHGGITQHIGAYSVVTEKGKITFLDTPGHEAFTSMRARGAGSTDIIILVIAADDGVMPQTREAVQHAHVAKVPIIVAVNKIDKSNSNLDCIKNDLLQLNVVPEEWGGDVMFVNVSAKTGFGINTLLDTILLQAEYLELKAVKKGLAKGVVIESRIDKGRGPVASILVKNGELRQGDIILCGTEYGRIRMIMNDLSEKINIVHPSMPVEIFGLSGLPNAGDDMLVVKNEKVAREVASIRIQKKKEESVKHQKVNKLSRLFNKKTLTERSNNEYPVLKVILKADTQGSVEVIHDSLIKLTTEKVKVDIISSGIGEITTSDVLLASASEAVLIGFNTRADLSARKQAELDGIRLYHYSIIYDLINDVKRSLSEMLSPELKEEIIGLAEVRDIFKSSKSGVISGCMVINGTIIRDNPIRVLRNQSVIYEGSLESLRRFKDDVVEVSKGLECGIGINNYSEIKTGDQIESFKMIEIEKKYSDERPDEK